MYAKLNNEGIVAPFALKGSVLVFVSPFVPCVLGQMTVSILPHKTVLEDSFRLVFNSSCHKKLSSHAFKASSGCNELTPLSLSIKESTCTVFERTEKIVTQTIFCIS